MIKHGYRLYGAWILVALAMLLLTCPGQAQTCYSVTKITMPGNESSSVVIYNGARGLNNNGDAVVTSNDENGQFTYVFKNGVATRLDLPGYFLTPIGINDSGLVAFNGVNLGNFRSAVLLYDPQKGFQQIGVGDIAATGLNNSGQVIANGRNVLNDNRFHTYVLGAGGERTAWAAGNGPP